MSAKLIDLTGKRFGRLLVINRGEYSKHGVRWVCECDCGTIKEIYGHALRSGNTVSCGCYQRENNAKIQRRLQTTHGMSNTPIFRRWLAMRYRCYDTNHKMYYRYGGRGITVCNEWKDNFEAFYAWAVENGFDKTLTLDRIDGDKGYSPENCRWADRKEQYLNKPQRRNKDGTFA